MIGSVFNTPQRGRRNEMRKSLKKLKINVTISPDVNEYIRGVAEAECKSISQVLDDIVRREIKRYAC